MSAADWAIVGTAAVVLALVVVGLVRDAYRRGRETGRDEQWIDDACALQRTLAARRDRTGRFAPARGPLVLPPRKLRDQGGCL